MTNLAKFIASVCCVWLMFFLTSCSESLPSSGSKLNETIQPTKQNALIKSRLTPRIVDAWSEPTTVATEVISSSDNGYFIGPMSQVLGNEQWLQWRVASLASEGQTTSDQQRTEVKYRNGLTGVWQDNAPTDGLADRSLALPQYFLSPQGELYALWHRNGIVYFSFKRAGQAWNSEVKVAAGSWGHIAFDDQGNAAVFWSHPILAGVTHINARMYHPDTGWGSNVHALERGYQAGVHGLPLSHIAVAYLNQTFQVIWSDSTGVNTDGLQQAMLDPNKGWTAAVDAIERLSLLSGERVTTLNIIKHHGLNQAVLVAGVTDTGNGERRVVTMTQGDGQWLPSEPVDVHDVNATQAKTLSYQVSQDNAGLSVAWVEQQTIDTETYQVIRVRQYLVATGWTEPAPASPPRLVASSDPSVNIPALSITDFNVMRKDNTLAMAWVERNGQASELYMVAKSGAANFGALQLIYTANSPMTDLTNTALSIDVNRNIMISWLEERPGPDGREYHVLTADYQGGGNTATPTAPAVTTPGVSAPTPAAAAWTAPSQIWSGSLFATSEAIFVGPNFFVNEDAGQDIIEFQFGGQFNVLTGDFGATDSFVLVGDGAGAYTENSPIPASDDPPQNVGSAIDAVDGNVYFMWSYNSDLKLAVFSAGAWGESTVISSGDQPVFSKIDANPTGGAVIFWATGSAKDYQFNAVDIAAGGVAGTVATEPAEVLDIQDVIVNQTGELFVASLNGDFNDFFAPMSVILHRFAEGRWGQAESKLSDGTFQGLDLFRSSVQLATGATGRIVVFLDATFGQSRRRFRRNIYSIWINFRSGWDERWNNIDFNLGFDDRITESMNVAHNQNGVVMVVWAEDSVDVDTGDPVQYVFASQYYADHNPITLNHWGPPARVSTTPIDTLGTYPAITVNEVGDALAVWLTYDNKTGEQILYSNTFVSGNWGEVDEVVATFDAAVDGLITDPSLSISALGALTVGWLQTQRQLFSRDYQIGISSSTF